MRAGPRRVARLLLAGLRRYWAIAALAATWAAWIVLEDVPPIVAPAPWDVAVQLADVSVYGSDLVYTLRLAAGALAVGMAAGIVLGIASSLSALARGVVLPAALFTRSIPIVALIPIFAILVGYNARAVFLTAVATAFFPAFVFTVSGLAATPAAAIDVARVLGAGRMRALVHVALPAAAPSIMVACRISAAACVLSAMAGEYLLSTEGLGRLIAESQFSLQVRLGWTAALVATFVAVAAFSASASLEQLVRRRTG